VLLCNQIFLTGPGHLYKLRFHASNTVQITHVNFRSTSFYNAGLFVTPVGTSNATIGIGVNVGVEPRPGAPGRVRVEPNPSFGRVQFVSEGGAGRVEAVEILDVTGRVVRSLAGAGAEAGARLTWDGRDARGMRVPAGVYQARIHRDGQTELTRVVLLP
jgi:flagellar hook capping protein FlgD